MAPVLGYWNSRGLAQSIRFLLVHVGADFEDKRYTYNQTPEESTEWTNEKFKLGLDFPNLPYWIDGNTKITQSLAILRYLGRKHDLIGKTEEEKIRVDMMEQQLKDLRASFVRVTNDADFPKAKAEWIKNLPTELKLMSDFLGNKPYFAGKNITYVDFLAYEFIGTYNFIAPKVVGEFPNLVKFLDRIDTLPNIAKYKASSKYVDFPWGISSKWGSK
jgi:glutathione S-transferase